MKSWLGIVFFMLISSVSYAGTNNITVYQDPNCGCCDGWAQHMRDSGFEVKSIKTPDMASIKEKLGIKVNMASCHTAVIDDTGQIIEGHVPANAVNKLISQPKVKGVAAPGMPLNSPGMGELDGTLVTVDFDGNTFSID